MIPVALAIFGIGMTAGNLYGGRLADMYHSRGIVAGYGCALAVLVVLAFWGMNSWVLFSAMFGVGATMMAAIPTIQVRLTSLAPESATLMGAMNLASSTWPMRSAHGRAASRSAPGSVFCRPSGRVSS